MTDDTPTATHVEDAPTTAPIERRRQVGEFLEGARWFGGKGREGAVTDVRRLGRIAEDSPRVVVDLVEVTYPEGDVELYQLPLALYAHPEHRLDHAFVGWWEDPEVGWTHAYDAVHDREAMAAYLRAFAAPPDGPLTFHTLPGEPLDATVHSTPFTGEQSNSSVAFGEEALLKIFRRVTPGTNPDIEIHDVLTAAGSDNVASLLGWVGVSTPLDHRTWQVAMLQQFLRTASDGWELALTSVRNLFAEADLYADEVGGDFAGEAQRLGEAVARIHALLAEHFPSTERTSADHRAVAAGMNSRLEQAIEVVPELLPHAAELRALFAAVGRIEVGTAQRIHGDLHLGQTLRTVKGWKIVDFEGEPSKTLAERRQPDSVWRDVAGMLRSFDYAPHVAARTAAATTEEGSDQRAFRAAEWSARNRAAFLEAYAERELSDDEQTLLAAYVADKAVYECVYEARNRPTWLPIPLAALSQALASGGAS